MQPIKGSNFISFMTVWEKFGLSMLYEHTVFELSRVTIRRSVNINFFFFIAALPVFFFIHKHRCGGRRLFGRPMRTCAIFLRILFRLTSCPHTYWYCRMAVFVGAGERNWLFRCNLYVPVRTRQRPRNAPGTAVEREGIYRQDFVRKTRRVAPAVRLVSCTTKRMIRHPPRVQGLCSIVFDFNCPNWPPTENRFPKIFLSRPVPP